MTDLFTEMWEVVDFWDTADGHPPTVDWFQVWLVVVVEIIEGLKTEC